jgi:hypothetical protein
MTGRRFPPPWRAIEHEESFWVQDATGQTVGWFVAVNVARLPQLLGKPD